MTPQAWIALFIGLAGIAGQIVTAFVVVQVAVRVIETRMEYAEGEVNRLREWKNEVVEPKLTEHDRKLGRLEVRVDYLSGESSGEK